MRASQNSRTLDASRKEFKLKVDAERAENERGGESEYEDDPDDLDGNEDGDVLGPEGGSGFGLFH